MTVFSEFPSSADLRSSRVDTRTVEPLTPPVVLCPNHNVKIEARTGE